MARELIPSDATIRAIRPGDKRKRLSDGDGLFLLLYPDGGSHGWRFDYRFEGRRKLISLGTYPDTSLALARRKADNARALVAEGVDPSAKRRVERQGYLSARAEEKRVAKGLPPTDSFETLAREWFAVKRSGWAKGYADKIMIRLEGDVFPWIGRVPAGEVTRQMVLELLRRIEARGVLETAHRVQACCSQIFRYAIAMGRLEKDPAAQLRQVLQRPNSKNFPAITDPARLGELLRACDRYAATPVVRAALKLAPMLLLRPGELRFAEWHEIDLDAALWTVPSVRMKRELRQKLQGAPHLVPLPRQAVEVFRDLHVVTGGGPTPMVFRGERHHHRPMSENTINAALRAMGFSAEEVTGHGFRATARTMLHERLGFSPDVIEAQLAHAVRDNLGRAYNRTEFIEQRHEMLQTWADYLDQLRLGQNPANAAVRVLPKPLASPLPHAEPDLLRPLVAPEQVVEVSSDVQAVPANLGSDSKVPTDAAGASQKAPSMAPSVAVTRELSTIEAAKFLNVSHLFVAQQIDAGRLKFRQVGADLRIALPDLVAYALEDRLSA